MTATAGRTPDAAAPRGSAFSDTVVLTWRNLKRIPRIPELAAFAILQSVMFVLLFAFVFGGAIPLPGGGSYREYLMPGIFAQTLAFASATTTVGVTDDMQKGLVDRFRSLPMARSAFLTGRTIADVVYNAGILVVLMVTGLAVGWRIRDGLPEFLGAIGIALLAAGPLAAVTIAIATGPAPSGRVLAVSAPWREDGQALAALADAGVTWAVPLLLPGTWVVEFPEETSRGRARGFLIVPIVDGLAFLAGCGPGGSDRRRPG